MLNATPLLKLYATWRNRQLAAMNPAQEQQRQLLQLVRYAADTRFGREHQFSKVQSVEDFQKSCPLRTYEHFWKSYWQGRFPDTTGETWPDQIPYFAVSSGTTSGTTKYIPVSRQMLRSNNKAGTDLLVHHLNNNPHSKIFSGKTFLLGGSTELVLQQPGTYSGDLSGIAFQEMPWWAKARTFPSPELALLSDWEEKIALMTEAALKEPIRSITGVPSWLLIFLEHAFSATNGASKICDLFPELEMIVHGGVNFSPYIDQFQELLTGSNAELREVYPASEGFLAVADRAYGKGMRLVLDHGIFYEFVPLEELDSDSPTRHWIANVQPDINYAVIMTTCAGLWSYVIGDTVKFVDTEIPRVLVTGRTSYYLSAFGEHLIGEEIEKAVSAAASTIGLHLSDYAVGPVYPEKDNPLGGHRYVVEFAEGVPEKDSLQNFSRVIDETLSKLNEDYEAHRADGFGLRAPEILSVPQGTFEGWMKSRGKHGGQNKVPRIINDQELFDGLVKLAQGTQL
jgi:hypothetical protein